MNNGFKLKWIRTLILVIGFISAWILYRAYKYSQLYKNYKIVTGRITHVSPAVMRGTFRSVEYEFIVNDKKYSGAGKTTYCKNYQLGELRRLLVDQKFSIAYDSTDPSNNAIIFSVKAATQFKQKPTDMLLHFDSIINCIKIQ
ncbi:MAG: hypothetical protein V4539_06355 [Bacteroidota bacterium]